MTLMPYNNKISPKLKKYPYYGANMLRVISKRNYYFASNVDVF